MACIGQRLAHSWQGLLQGAERAQPAAEHATAPNDEAYDHERQQHAQQRVGEQHGQAVVIDEPEQPRKNVDDAELGPRDPADPHQREE